METFSALLDFCAGNSAVTGEFPAQKPVTRSFDVSFDLRNREAGDMRRYRAHYDVIVMWQPNKTHLNDGNTIATIDCMHDPSSGPA